MSTVDSLLVVDFAAGGNSQYYRVDGWGAPEPRMAWGLGPRSFLRLPAPWDARTRVLELDLNPCRHEPVATGQILRIVVNGRRFGCHLLTERTLIRCRLHPVVWDGRESLDIALEHPFFLVPKLLRLSGDTRPLAISCFSARLYSQREARPGLSLPALPETPATRTISAEPTADPPRPSEPGGAARTGYTFGARGTARPFTRDGWALPERHVQWTDSHLAFLDLPAPEMPRALLYLDVVPFTLAEKCPAQDVTITLDGLVLGQFSLTEPAVLAVPLPSDVVAGQETLRLGFHLPAAARPRDLGQGGDSRLLGLCFRAIGVETLARAAAAWADRRVDEVVTLTPLSVCRDFCGLPADDLATAIETLGMTPAALVRRFESLGDNCEFGMVQRKLGLTAFGPFGFGFTPLIGLLRAFDDDFAAALDHEAVEITLSPAGRQREYLVGLPRYGIRNHSFVSEDEVDAETVRLAQAERLARLRDGFHESLRGGETIFVLLRDRALTLAEVLPVLQALNRYGRNTLLYVVQGAATGDSGSVELLAPGLLRGHIGAFAPAADVMAVDPTDWLRLCANAWRLTR